MAITLLVMLYRCLAALPISFILPNLPFCLIAILCIISCVRVGAILPPCPSSKQVFRCVPTIATFQRRLFWSVIFFLPTPAFGSTVSSSVFRAHWQPTFAHLVATRVGEASHPGPCSSDPAQQFCTFAITNPTSIVSKFEIYQELARDFSLDVICAAETAATPLAQKVFGAQMRKIGMRSAWSQPVGEKVSRTDGQPSLRGNASGVATFSKWPLRHAVDTLSVDIKSTARLIHVVVSIMEVQIQLVVIYGLAAAGTVQQTTALFQEALRVTQLLPLPFIILGDFNCNPWNLPIQDQFAALGLVDLPMMYTNLRHSTMPFTCKNATRPDNALISVPLQPFLVDVSVLPTPWFDAHQVVLFTLDLQGFQTRRMKMPMPAPWSELAINYDHAQEGYARAVATLGQPNTIESWGIVVEDAIDFAFRSTQMETQSIPWAATKPVPKKYTGRCQPRQPQPAKPVLVTLPFRKCDFNPGELCRRQTRAKVQQVRRIQSLLGQLVKTQNVFLEPLRFKQLWDEWQAILRSPCMGGCFVAWCQNTPELGPPPMGLPSVDFLSLLGQFVKHDATASAAIDAKLIADMKTFHTYQDAKWCGHAQSYMHLKDNFVAPFDALGSTETRDVHVTSNDDASYQVWCDQPLAFMSNQLVYVDEHPCTLLSKDEWSLTVRPVERCDLTEAATVSQHLEIQEPTDIFARLQNYWAPFWQRPDEQLQGDADFARFLDMIPDHWIPPQVDMDNLELWTSAIHDLKTPSARGIDAISSWELKRLPTQAIADMKNVLVSYKTGFPCWFLRALTAPVPKIPEVPEVHQVRPITILAQLYRVWSRVLCRQLLAHLGATMPPQLTGLLANRGPLDASMRQQFFVEKCRFQAHEASGLSLDLIKCYNTISRSRVHQLLHRLKFPAQEIDQWFASIQQLSRLWTFQGWCSTLEGTCCGLPEGDTFSVVCMIVIDYLWILAVQANADDPFLSTYADNIGWATQRFADHDHIIPTTVKFARCFGMAIDWAKTWIWGTTPAVAKKLQQCLMTHVPEVIVAIRRTAMDLGAQLTYSGPPILGQFRKRIDRAVCRLKRLRTMKIPLKSKALLLQGGVYSVMFYGIALLPLGTQHLDMLRPLCADALLGKAPNRNSAIALAATPGVVDPMVHAITIVVRTVRRFLNQLSPSECLDFYHIASRHDGQANHVHGPAGVLRYWLGKLGWSVSNTGLLDVQTFCNVPLRTTSNASLVRWIQKEWDKEVFQFHCRRSAIAFVQFDLRATRRLIQSFPSQQQPALLNELSGAFQTEQQKQHWAHDSTGNCRHCQVPDTREHRLFDCAATDEIRTPYKLVLDSLQAEGRLVHELPAFHLDQEVDLLTAVHLCHPEATVSQPLLDRFHQLATQDYVPNFYTDGSLHFPEDPTARHAAYAITLDLLQSDEQRIDAVRTWIRTGQRPATFATLAVARTTGEQRIHRSELYAVLRVCELFRHANIHADATATISIFNKCLNAARPGQLQTHEDFDLIERLWHSLRRGSHAIFKVKAHATHAHPLNYLQCYHTWGNEAANEAAISTCLHMHPEISAMATKLHAANELQKSQLTQIYKLHLELHHARAMLDAQQKTRLPHEELRPSGPPQAKILADWKIEDPMDNPVPRIANLALCAWGESLSRVMLNWMLLFKWPKHESVSGEDPGITFLELMLSFHLYSGLLPPVKRTKGDKGEFLQPLEAQGDLELHAVTFGELGSIFAVWLAQLRKLLSPDVWPSYSHGPCRSLYRLGSGTQGRGICTRPQFPCQDRVIDLLARYIRTHEDFVEMPLLDICPIPRQAHAQIRHPWDQLRRQSSKGAATTRASAGSVPLRFR